MALMKIKAPSGVVAQKMMVPFSRHDFPPG
jgi:hypothetical protein